MSLKRPEAPLGPPEGEGGVKTPQVSSNASQGHPKRGKRHSREVSRRQRQRDFALGWHTGAGAIEEIISKLSLEPNASQIRERVAAAVRSLPKEPIVFPPQPPTIRELSLKYRISPRAVSYWKAAGCPFAKGQQAVIAWSIEHNRTPPRFQEKYVEQIGREEIRTIIRDANRELEQLRRAMPAKLRRRSEGSAQ